MANITDPQVIKFCNEVVRPLADKLIGVDAVITAETITWVAEVAPSLASAADADIVDDGASEDGRTPLTKADIINFVTQLAALTTLWSAAGVRDVISKPHVNVFSL